MPTCKEPPHTSVALKRCLVFVAIGFFVLRCFAGPSNAEEFPILRGDYLGQEPPGLTPMKFAPGIISTDGNYEGGATFSADGKLFIYKRYYADQADPAQIWLSKTKDGRWTRPVRASFDGEYSDWDFSFAPSGLEFYFTSKRPAIVDGKEANYAGIWMTEFRSSGWTEPRRLGPPVNLPEAGSGYPSLTKNGTIYFHSRRADSQGKLDIYRARLTDGEYRKAENVGAPVNTAHAELDPCIAPDESYLIFTSARPTTYQQPNGRYISFRNADDSWSEPKGLGPILGDGALPQITADGRYLFFVRGGSEDSRNADIYWVDTKVLDQHRPKDSH